MPFVLTSDSSVFYRCTTKSRLDTWYVKPALSSFRVQAYGENRQVFLYDFIKLEGEQVADTVDNDYSAFAVK